MKKPLYVNDARAVASWIGQDYLPYDYNFFNTFKDRKHWVLTLNYFLTFGGFLALTSYLPIFFNE